MKQWKLKCAILIILAMTLLGAVALGVGAARFVGDVNEDGKITVFDAQLLAEQNNGMRDLTEAQKTAAGDSSVDSLMEYILGEPADLGDLDGDGAYEIFTAEGLYHIAQNPTLSYELTADIDLDGAEWTPVKGFSGSFNGNGYAVSNAVINTSMPDNANASEMNMGFFGDVTIGGTVADLHLRDVIIHATEDAEFIGLLVGSSRGQVENCTVTGAIYDTRDGLGEKPIYVGAMVGRITNSSKGTVIPGDSISVTDDTGNYTVDGLAANVGMNVVHSDNVIMGLIGWNPGTHTITAQWCDSANDGARLSQTMQDRQDVVVDYMNAMGEVQWQVSEHLFYDSKENGSVDQHFYPGVTYYGLPYTSMHGTLERFMSKIDSSSGTNITVTGLENSYWSEEIGGYDGFAQYLGNDCSSAVGFAWLRVSPIRVKNGEGDQLVAGGVYPKHAIDFVPHEYVQTTWGVYPVGDWTFNRETRTIDGTFAYEVTAADGDTRAVYESIGEETLLEAYAMARKADALTFCDPFAETPKAHARLLVADPIVIRNEDGSIDTDKSFVVVTEQGDGLGDRKTTNSSWRINYQYTFETLMAKDPSINYDGSDGVYLPVTIRALRSDDVTDAYWREYPEAPVVSPVSGMLYSNFRIISSTVVVTDDRGNVIYDNEAFTGVSHSAITARDKYETIDLGTYHAEAFASAANAAGMKDGGTYFYTVQLLLSNGETKTIKAGEAFTYTAAE